MSGFSDQQVEAALRRLASPVPLTQQATEWFSDRGVLALIATGLVLILLTIILGLLLTPRALPNWAENVFVSVATATSLKLGDAISALVQLSSGRNNARLGGLLAGSAPSGTIKAGPTNDASNPVPTTDVATEEPKP